MMRVARLLRQTAITSLACLSVACSEDPLIPPGVVTGQWGGEGAQLIGGTRGASLNLGCGPLLSSTPMVLDIEGQIYLEVQGSSGPKHVAYGTIDGDVVALTVVQDDIGDAIPRQFTLRRGVAPDYGNVACALTGR